MKKYLNELAVLLDAQVNRLFYVFILYGISSVLEVITLGLIGPYIAMIVRSKPPAMLKGIFDSNFIAQLSYENMVTYGGLSLLFLFLVKAVYSIYVNYYVVRFCMEQLSQLRLRLNRAYQLIPYVDFLNINSSHLVNSVQNMTYQFSINALLPAIRMVGDLVVGIVILALLIWVNWFALLVLVLLMGLLIAGYDLLVGRVINSYGEKANIAQRVVLQNLNEESEGFKEIRILGKEYYFFNNIKYATNDYCHYQAKSVVLSTVPRYLLEVILISFVVILTHYTLAAKGGLLSLVPTLSIFGIASIRLLPIANSLSYGISQIRYGRDVVTSLHKDLSNLYEYKHFNYSEKRSVEPNPSKSFGAFQSLQLNEVSFSYPETTQLAINKITMSISAGESIGIIGPSGAGKSTLIDLLLGLLIPQSGQILYNGKELKQLTDDWHSQVAYLPQKQFVLDDTLWRNLTIEDSIEKVDISKLDLVLRQSCLADFVESLPQGVHTTLGEGGCKLSGGQRQRISLARALYHDRNVLILDEATSALDNETEKEVVEIIDSLKRIKTIIVISHRMSTLQNCDRVYALKNGSIEFIGKPEDVLNVT